MSHMAKIGAPIWYDGFSPVSFPRLERDAAVDICIIGGGIAGVTAAYLLSGKGLRVALIEKDALASGATGATTAILSSVLDTDMSDLLSLYGEERARVIIASHTEAISQIEHAIEKESLECDFVRCPAFLYASDSSQRESLESELIAGQKLGYDISRAEKPLGMRHFGALEVKSLGKFHPLKYLYGLARAAKRGGVQIYEKTEATALDGEGPIHVRTNRGTISARYVFVATYEPFTKPFSLYFKKAFYVSYMLAGSIRKGALPEGTYEDFANPYTYFRIDAGKDADRIILGGADHRADLPIKPAKNYKALEDHARRIFAGIDYSFKTKWRGPILEPIDALAYIGQFGNRYTYVAFGFSGNGMTYGTLSAKMFADHALGNGSPYTGIYDPSRIPGFKDLFVKGRDYVGELFGGAVKNALTH